MRDPAERSLGAVPTPAVVDEGIADVRLRARQRLAEAVLRAIDPSWAPPPYDPWLIAQALGIRCIEVRQESFRGAMICVRAGELVILYRRQKDEARTRFSLFHEIAHTLFPGFGRGPLPPGPGSPLLEPEGRLERLCDAAALEMMIPEDHFRADLARDGFGGARVDELCRCYQAGIEAVALRMVDSDDAPACAVALVEHERPRQQGGRRPRLRHQLCRVLRALSRAGLVPGASAGVAEDLVSALNGTQRQGRQRPRTAGSALRRPAHLPHRGVPLTDRPRRKGRSAVLAFFAE
ncbi:MAG: ImmA/IrrE family metallo-endopeptidase [Candidatus Latescibacterota bacterium]